MNSHNGRLLAEILRNRMVRRGSPTGSRERAEIPTEPTVLRSSRMARPPTVLGVVVADDAPMAAAVGRGDRRGLRSARRASTVGIGAFLLVYLIGRLVVVRGIVRLVAARNSRNPTLVEAVERYTYLLVVTAALAAASAAAGRLPPDRVGDRRRGADAGYRGRRTGSDRRPRQRAVSGRRSGVQRRRLDRLGGRRGRRRDDPLSGAPGPGARQRGDHRSEHDAGDDGCELPVQPPSRSDRRRSGPVVRRRLRRRGRPAPTDGGGHRARPRRPETVRSVAELRGDAVHLRTTLRVGDPSPRSVIDVRSAYAWRAKPRLQDAGFTVSPPAERDLSGRLTVDGDETSG